MVSWHKGSNGWVGAPNPAGRSPNHKAGNKSSDVGKRWSRKSEICCIKKIGLSYISHLFDCCKQSTK